MASSVQLAFIDEIAPLIQSEAKSRGYLVCSPIIAQATTESFKGRGLSQLASKYHNYFGMKCGSKWSGKSVKLSTGEEYTVGTITTIKDNFRVYDSMADGVKGYFDFINTPRYANLKTAQAPEEYLQRIKADGYATSSTYVTTNLNRINIYGLREYDWNPPQYAAPVIGNPYPVPAKTLRKGDKGHDVRWLQYALNERHYGLIVDGVFGQKTDEAVRSYQAKQGLAVDGIVGARTRGELLAGK